MTDKEKAEKYKAALVSLYHVMKTQTPNYLHQIYINEVLELTGEEKQQ